jgi:signal transduction histidine kinase
MNLSTKFAVAATALTAFIVGGVILNAVQRERRMIVQEVERKGMILAETLAMASVNALLSHDYSTLKRFLEAAGKDPDIVYAMVLDPTGIIKMHTDLSQIGRSVIDDVGARALDSDEVLIQRVPGRSTSPVYDVAAPVLAAGRQVGVLRLGLSTQSMQAALRRSRVEVALIGLAALILGIGGAIALTRRISRPLRELVAGARAVSRGDLTWRARVGSRDEIGELAAAFSSMTASLQTHIDERIREERLVLLGKLAAGIAHEVRNPLEAIKGAATVLEGNGAPDATVRKFTHIIKDEVTDLNQFLEGFLEFARPAPLRLAESDMGAIADEVVTLLEPLLGERRIRASMDVAQDLPPIHADAHQIKQVLMNLCLNAIQAMPDGGEMVLTGRPAEDEGRSGVEFSVRDTGAGVAEAVRHQVFEPFITTKAGGSGLGLAVSRSIIERHAGRIRMESAPGRGSTFSIWLPGFAETGTEVAATI